MTDYHPLIARAVDGLDRSTGEARRALYERARNALVAQLRSSEPALSEAEITKERLALEEAIRKVEAEAARKSRTEPRAEAKADPRLATLPPVMPDAGAQVRRAPVSPPRRERASPPPTDLPRAGWTAVLPSARERLLSGRSSLKKQGIKGFRDVVGEVRDLGAATAKAAQSARQTRDSYEVESGAGSPQQSPPAEDSMPPSSPRDFETQFDAEEMRFPDYETQHMRGLEPPYEIEDEAPVASTRPHPPRALVAEEDYESQRRPRSYGGLARLVVVLIILLGVVATIAWQWSTITGFYHFFAQTKPPSQTLREAPTTQPKFSGRVPQEQAGQAPAAGMPGGQAVPAVAQRVVLYEEDANDPQGKRYIGSAIWRTETVSPGPGLAPELAVRADVEIPERRMTVTWSLRRNTDKALPASHTIEIMFNLPADFAGGGIANVPGILMKQAEQARGTPLAGLAVKVTNGFFLVGLSAVDTDVQRNVQLLKDRSWFDIPIVYTNGGRAILAMEKGPPGDRAFADAFAAWGR
ncbi:MAG TPA: hypothetical protein VK430_04765 [Xanthobacteraceae bacterium]|nr:hypothetical protein [Xanthobacteraceae bacterium]